MSARMPCPAKLALICTVLTVPVALVAQGVPARRLSLGDAARVAAERSPTTVAAKERAAQGGARVTQARAALLPSLSTDAIMDGGTDQRGLLGGAPGGRNPLAQDRTVDLRVQATQPLLDLAAIGRLRSASMEAEATASNAQAASEAAAERGALSYVRLLRAQARLDARRADSTLSAELLEIARQQLNAGTAIALDVTRAQSQLAGNVSDLISARAEVARAELELKHALALPLDTPVELADSLRRPSLADGSGSEADAVRSALTHRGDVQAAAAWSEAARREVGAIRAERLPTVSLFSNLASTTDGVLDGRTYGIQVSLPIFDGFRRESRIAETRAREREANAEWDDLRQRVEVDVRSALLDLSAAREQVAAADVRLSLAEQEVAQSRERFRAGLDDNSDVIAASLTLNAARDVVVDALASYHNARVGLASAEGRTVELE